VLFEVDLADFDEILDAIKVTANGMTKLTGGLEDVAESAENSDGGGFVRTIFNRFDNDRNGIIDKEELRKIVDSFDLELDQQQDEVLGDMVDAIDTDADGVFDYHEFRAFLVKFLHFQMYAELEEFVTNRALFTRLGGRDVYTMLKLEEMHERELESENAELRRLLNFGDGAARERADEAATAAGDRRQRRRLAMQLSSNAFASGSESQDKAHEIEALRGQVEHRMRALANGLGKALAESQNTKVKDLLSFLFNGLWLVRPIWIDLRVEISRNILNLGVLGVAIGRNITCASTRVVPRKNT